MKLNGSVKWCSVVEPNTKFDPQWVLSLYPDKAVVKKLNSLGFVIKNDDDGDFIRVKRACTTRAGKKMDPPKVVGRDGKTEFKELIGNGSEVNVLFADYEVNGKKYAYLNAVQVLKHVPFGESFDDETDGEEDEVMEDTFENERF